MKDGPPHWTWYRRGTGRTLVMLHGFTGAPGMWADAWRPLVAGLEQRGRACRAALAPVLPGHLGAEVASDFAASIDALAAAAEDALGGDVPVDLVGYSLGARTALGWAARHPQRIASLTLVGVHPGLADDDARRARRRADRAWIDLLREQGIDAFVDAWETQPVFAAERARCAPAVLAAQRAVRRSHTAEGLAGSLATMGLGEMPDYRSDLIDLAARIPVTLVVGECDRKFSAIASELIAAAPRLELVQVPESGHNVLLSGGWPA